VTEPVIYAESRAPDLTGPNGRAWKSDIAAVARRYPGGPPHELTVVSWVVEARWAHPLWHSYFLCAISLREVPGWPPAQINLAGATHEVMLYALDPNHKRALNDRHRYLQPSNFHGQWKAESDEAAAAFIEETVKLILNGQLSPDTDFRRDWIARFSDSNMKGADIPPGLVGVGGDGVLTFVGTGKQNADTIIDIAAGP
jgi:hypothetical protein